MNYRNKYLGFNQSHAFLIGIDKYPGLDADLKNAVRDASMVAQLLKEQQQFDNVFLMENSDKLQIETLLKWIANPERSKSLQIPGSDNAQFGWLNNDTKNISIDPEKDSILFYYAGHGIPMEIQDGPAGYIVPSDAKSTISNDSLVAMDAVYQALVELNCKHTLLILDCCFAGRFRFANGQRFKARPRIAPLYERRFNRYKTNRAWQVLVSAGPEQTAADSAHWKSIRDNSPFADTLIKALNGEADQSMSQLKSQMKGDGVIIPSEILLYVWNKVDQIATAGGKLQHPGLFPMAQHGGGEFIFLNPKISPEQFQFAEDPEKNPYKGLTPYEIEDHNLFFGRDRIIKDLLSKLRQSELVFVSGPSGSGKSSIIKAGLGPFLQQQAYRFKIYRPAELKYVAIKLEGEKNLILIDQLEEVFDDQQQDYIIDQIYHLRKRMAYQNDLQLDQWISSGFSKLIQPTESDYIFLEGQFEEEIETNLIQKWRNIAQQHQYHFETFQPSDWFVESHINQIDAQDWLSGKQEERSPTLWLITKYERLFKHPQRKSFETALQKIVSNHPELKIIIASEQRKEEILKNSLLFKYRRKDNLLNLPIKNHLLLFTLRSDFEWQLHKSKLEQLWKRPHIYRIPPLNLDELREAITEPAWYYMYDFKDKNIEDGSIDDGEVLINTIVEELNNAPGALSLLSFTMHSFFEKSKELNRDRKLLLSDYKEQLGGVAGAIRRKANQAYDNLSAPEQAMFKQLILRMILVNDGTFSRRKVLYFKGDHPLNELDFGPKYNSIRDQVIQKMGEGNEDEKIIGANLLIQGIENGQPFVTPIHDALINHWEKCREWIDDFEKEYIILKYKLWQAVTEQINQVGQNRRTAYRAAVSNSEADRSLTNKMSTAWENNPRLFQVLDLLAKEAKHLLQPEAVPVINLTIKHFDDSEMEAFQKIWKECQEKQHFPELNSLIIPGFSELALQLLFDNSKHLLNKSEKEFIQKSWQARIEDILALKKDKEEAVKAKMQAENLNLRVNQQNQAFKTKLQQQSRRELHLLKSGIRPNLHLILIGLGEYPKPIQSFLIEKDLETIRNSFKHQKGLLYEEVYIHELLKTAVTRENIMETIEKVKKEVSIFDYIIIYVATQCVIYPFDSKESSALVGYCDIEYVNDLEEISKYLLTGKELCTSLMESKAKVILILDICHGGEFLDTLIKANRSGDPEKIAHNVFALSGTRFGQLASIEKGQGLFTKIIGEALRLNYSNTTSPADLDNNGVVYLDELVRYATVEMGRQNKNQDVFAVVPTTMSNIPLIQTGPSFEFPYEELPLTGHVDDPLVVQSILALFGIEDEEPSDR